MEIDTKDPMVRRFAEAIIAWTPRDWEALDARMTAHAKLWAERRGPPTLEEQRFFNFLARTRNLLDPSPETLKRIERGTLGLIRRLEYGTLGPRWRRQGTGLIRRLYETLEHPWVKPVARSRVAMIVGALSHRRYYPVDDLQRLYAPFEAAIPWTSIAPPLLPDGTGDDNPG
jgi:hypothetical protein